MKFEDYMLLPKERLAQLLVEAEERYNALLTSAVSNRSGSTCSEHISSVRREAALKRWYKQPMQNMQIASCKSDTNTDNCYANAMQIAMQNEDAKTDANAMQIASCKCNSESDTNDANAMQMQCKLHMQNDANCTDGREKETEKEERKDTIKKEEKDKEKETFQKKENKIYFTKEKKSLPEISVKTDEEKEKGCAEKEKEEIGDLSEAKPEPIQNNQKTENMQQNKENAPKTANLFDFRKRLEELVASDEHTKDYKQVIADWMVVRKKKGAANTLTAFKRVANQMEIARRAHHCTYEDCVRMSAENSWIGFEAAWIERRYGEARIYFRNAQTPDWKELPPATAYRDID